MITVYLCNEDGNIFALLGHARRWCKQLDDIEKYRRIEQAILTTESYSQAIEILREEFDGLVEFIGD